MARTHPWKVSDALWERVKPLLPAAPSHAKGGRPRMDDRKAFEAIVYLLRTGIQWNALPRELGASSTVHDRFQEWEQAGFFQTLWQAGLEVYDDLCDLTLVSSSISKHILSYDLPEKQLERNCLSRKC
jgi:putative transposase